MPADNERFGATAAVTPLKVTCEHERKQPAELSVSAAAAPSRQPLYVSGGDYFFEKVSRDLNVYSNVHRQ